MLRNRGMYQERCTFLLRNLYPAGMWHIKPFVYILMRSTRFFVSYLLYNLGVSSELLLTVRTQCRKDSLCRDCNVIRAPTTVKNTSRTVLTVFQFNMWTSFICRYVRWWCAEIIVCCLWLFCMSRKRKGRPINVHIQLTYSVNECKRPVRSLSASFRSRTVQPRNSFVVWTESVKSICHTNIFTCLLLVVSSFYSIAFFIFTLSLTSWTIL
jgi:hypothetical protein